MDYKIVFHPKAMIDISDSFNWYNQQQQGLGEKFEKEIEKQLLFIAEHPKAFKIIKHNFRETPLKKFPFVLVYKIVEVDKTIRIIAVYHSKRNPIKKTRN